MSSTTKRQSLAQEREQAKDELRKILKPGDTVQTVLRHVSRSGMQRVIDVHTMTTDADGRPWLRWIGHLVAVATDTPWTDKYGGGLKVGGCGMDMGFHLVYNLGYTLWPNGFGCVGEGCRSNDHSNGDRSYLPHEGSDDPSAWKVEKRHGLRVHWHKDAGYALRHEWI